MPIHNSTFDLALHDWKDPLEQVSALSEEQNVSLVTPMIGEKLNITKLQKPLLCGVKCIFSDINCLIIFYINYGLNR